MAENNKWRRIINGNNLQGTATKIELLQQSNLNNSLVTIKPDYDGASYGWVMLAQNNNNTVALAGRPTVGSYFRAGAAFGTDAGSYENYTVTVTSGGIGIEEAGEGIVLTSPNGTLYKLTVDDSGNLTTTAV